MSTTSISSTTAHSILDIMSVIAYVDDFPAALDFYTRILGLQVYGDAKENSCTLRVGDNPSAIYLEGLYTKLDLRHDHTRLSFMLRVDSVEKFYKRLQTASVPMVHDRPQQIGMNAYWFQCYDPAGNILEVVGRA